MPQLWYFLTSTLAILGTAVAASSVLDLDPTNFDASVLGSKKPALVEFFAPWCGHCKTLAPTYEELATSFASASDKVIIAKVDADKHKSLGKRFGVQGFPTIKWFDGQSATPIDYSGGRDLDSLSKWITDKTSVRPKAQKATPSAVQMLTDASWKTEIGADKDVLVAFTAPWCGHCKSLAPTWEALAQDFVTESGVTVAKVDAEAENSKATAKAEGVTSYPTIKYFPKGSTIGQAYTGGRSEEALISFLNEKAGTYRTVGGGLDVKAGTVEVLDHIVAKIATGGTVAAISEELAKAAASLKDTYAQYYVKVAGKLSASQDYVGTSQDYIAKELRRLEGILKKGGLASDQKDDITSRANVLRKFVRTDEKEEL